MATKLNANLNGQIAQFVGEPHTLAPVSKAWKEAVDKKLYPYFYREYCEVASLGGYIAEAIGEYPLEDAYRMRVLAVFQKMRQEGKTIGGFSLACSVAFLHPRIMEEQANWIAHAKNQSLVHLVKFIRDKIDPAKATELETDARQWLQKEPNRLGVSQISEIVLVNKGLRALPPEIKLLSGLECLSLRENMLVSLPNAIFQLRKLRSLALCDNSFESLPQEMGKLTNLQYLNLRHNKLPSLPDELAQLRSLTYINISHNLLTHIPDWVKKVQNHNFANNPIVQDPPPSRDSRYFAPLPPPSPPGQKKSYSAKEAPAAPEPAQKPPKPLEPTPPPAPASTFCEQVANGFSIFFFYLTERLTALYRWLFLS